jgi:hypothetical protein
MSPKEYTNNNKIISKGTPEQNSTYNRRKNGSAKSSKKIKNGVSKDLREGIFRNRIFEIYDNLSDLKSTEELVEEGVQRACKDLLVNRAKDFDDLGIEIDVKSAVKQIKNKFPYTEFPKNKTKARNFYTATICNLVSESFAEMVLQKH